MKVARVFELSEVLSIVTKTVRYLIRALYADRNFRFSWRTLFL